MAITNYPGNKGGQGIRETLFNYTPACKRYFSLFFGSGGFELRPEFKNIPWIIAEKNPKLQSIATSKDLVTFSDYRDLVANYNFTSDDFIFCDPPYIFETRKNSRRYYKNEFTIHDHEAFLNYIVPSKAKVLITHPKHKLYSTALAVWNCYTLRYMSRAGWFNDAIWCNYTPENVVLFNYNFLGNDRTTRQMIKRKRQNIIRKINALPFHEKMAIFKQLNLK